MCEVHSSGNNVVSIRIRILRQYPIYTDDCHFGHGKLNVVRLRGMHQRCLLILGVVAHSFDRFRLA